MGQFSNAKKLLKDINAIQSPQDLLETFADMEQDMALYESGIQEVRTKLEILQRDARFGAGHNPIESIKSRIKKPMSIIEKMHRKGYPISLESMRANLNDVAGIRVICPFIEDIYTVVEMLSRQDDLTVIEKKDYIQNPKPNGYRSYHMILEVPVFLSDRKTACPCGGSAAHHCHGLLGQVWNIKFIIRQSREVPDCVVDELKECADIIAHTDERMQSLSKQIRCIRDTHEK